MAHVDERPFGCYAPAVSDSPQKNLETIKRALSDNYLDLKIASLAFEEDFGTGQCKIRVVTRAAGVDTVVEGQGVGLIDALFSGLFRRYATEYQSLNTIKLTGFLVKARLESERGRLGADAVGEVTLEVQNSAGRPFNFSDASRSIVGSAARSVVAAVEYFVNSERAFVALHQAMEAAKERKRPDLVAQYTKELSEVVESTSYADVIEGIKKKL